jgi:hypothetical protein
MSNSIKKTIMIFISLSLVVMPGISFASEGNVNAISVTADLLIFRPAGIALVPVTAVLFAVAYPFTLIGDNTEKVYEALVAENLRYTFQRPLGEDVPVK